MKTKTMKLRLKAMTILSTIVIITAALWTTSSIRNNDTTGAIAGALIAATILAFAITAFIRTNKDLKEGFPLQDEMSKRVMEKATSRAFLISLYLLLAISFISDKIQFRDTGQALNVGVGGMALVFVVCWIYYSKKGI